MEIIILPKGNGDKYMAEQEYTAQELWEYVKKEYKRMSRKEMDRMISKIYIRLYEEYKSEKTTTVISVFEQEQVGRWWLFLLRGLWNFDSDEEYLNQSATALWKGEYLKEKERKELSALVKNMPTRFAEASEKERIAEKNLEHINYKIEESKQDYENINNILIKKQKERDRLNEEITQKNEEYANLDKTYQEKKLVLEREIGAQRRKLEQELKAEIEEQRKQAVENLSKEFAEKRREYDIELQKEKEILQNDVLKRVKEKEEELSEDISKRVSYKKRQEENERYLDEVRSDIKRRQQFEDRVCGIMNETSRSFKEEARELETVFEQKYLEMIEAVKENMKDTIEDFRRNTANAVNSIVDVEREIQKDDYEELLKSFGELQQKLFYKVPEEELGLQDTEIERFQKRFLKTLNRMGYQHFIPEVGSSYDEELYNIGENREEEEEREEDWSDENSLVVSGVIAYGFKKEDEVCQKAIVTVKKKNEDKE